MKKTGGVFLLAMTVMVIAGQIQAQNQSLKFEVTSVKPNTTGQAGFGEMPPSGRVNYVGTTFRTLMRSAYGVQDYRIIGGPAWLSLDRFDVQASPPPDFRPQRVKPCFADCPPTPVQVMMQGLLAERFQLKVHRETRELSAYELTIAKNGFKLKQVPEPSPVAPDSLSPPLPVPPRGTAPPTTVAGLPTPPPGVGIVFPVGFALSGVEFHALVGTLEGLLGRPVIDKTGIKGFYDFKVVYSREGLPGTEPPPPPVPTDGGPGVIASEPRPSIFTAIQEELGLKLESSKGPVEVLVIDSVSKPAEN